MAHALASVSQLVGAWSCAVKSPGFDSWSRQIPRQVHTGGNRFIDVSHINVSLSPSLSKIKVLKNEKEWLVHL